MGIADPVFEMEGRLAATSRGAAGPALTLRGGAVRLLEGFEGALEAERDRLALWLVVALGAGILLYFALPIEPPLKWGLSAVVNAGLLALFMQARRRLVQVLAFALLAAAVGFLAAQVRVRMVAAPVLTRPLGPAQIEGRLISTGAGTRGAVKALIAVERIEGLAPAVTPARARVSVRAAPAQLAPGALLRVRAMLAPPAGPVAPGAYDFSRRAFFARIGAVGYAVRPPEILPGPPAGGWAGVLERLRQNLAARIAQRVRGTASGVAVALATGLRRDIPETADQDLRNSGLYHLISISGVHMSALALGLFFGVRFLLALVEPLALGQPIKKWAAAVSIAGTFAYLFFTGASVPTIRSFVMVALVFLAVIADRRALTQRNVALAAGLILIFSPESLLDASFQMSFAATVALIAAYEVWTRTATPAGRRGEGGWLFRLLPYFLGLVLTGLIAGSAIAPFLAYHFQTATPLSLIANLAAIPVTDLVIMPAAFLTYLLAPLGLDGAAIAILGLGCDVLLWVAHAVAHLPGAVRGIPAGPPLALGMITLGGLWLALWQRPWRLCGLVPIALGLALWAVRSGPDILIGEKAENIALRDPSGRIGLIRGRGGRFETETWLRRDGLGQDKNARRAQGLHCDALGCAAPLAAGGLLAVSENPGSLADDCARARVVISTGAVRVPCEGPELVIDRRQLARLGAVAVLLHDGAKTGGDDTAPYEIRPARSPATRRPWSPVPIARAQEPSRRANAKNARLNSAGSGPPAGPEP